MITGEKIKKCRQLKAIPLKEFAHNLGWDISTYSRIERGETKLTEEKIEAILKELKFEREFVEQIDNMNTNNTFNDSSVGNFFIANQHNGENPNIIELISSLNDNIKNQNAIIEILLKKLT